MKILFGLYSIMMNAMWYVFYAPLIIPYRAFLLFFILYEDRIMNKKVQDSFLYIPNRFELWMMRTSSWVVDQYYELILIWIDMIFANEEQRKEKRETIMKAINPKEKNDYVCVDERSLPTKDQTVFEVTFLTAQQASKIRNELYSVTGVGAKRAERLLTGDNELKTLKSGLKGWRNFKNDKNEDVVFDASRVDDMIDMIPPKYRTELAEYIGGNSEVKEGEEKGSAAK